jgi:ATP-dependent helicase HrpB
MDPKQLPIYELHGELAEALKSESRIIIEAPTGSGKSTQVPQIVLDCGNAGPGEVVVLQPRRLAARLRRDDIAFSVIVLPFMSPVRG